MVVPDMMNCEQEQQPELGVWVLQAAKQGLGTGGTLAH